MPSVSERAEATYEKVRGAADKVAAEISRAAGAAADEISARPFASVATAFGIDMVLGLLFGRQA